MKKLNHIPKRDEFNSKFYYEPAGHIKVAIIFNPKTDEWIGIGYYEKGIRCGIERYDKKRRKNDVSKDLYKAFVNSLIDNDDMYEIEEDEIEGLLCMNELVS